MESLSLPSFYLSAPTSPGGFSPQNLRFYSTMSSPLHHAGEHKTTDDEFDFGSSRRLDNDGWPPSISTMAFADELFSDGQVLPLKLPPRLQRSVPTSPTAVRSRTRNPFAHRSKWNDDFDPFMIALEKVSEEPGGRMSVHRRSRSYSPFRARNISRTIESDQREPTITMINNQSRTNQIMAKKLWIGKRVGDANLSHESVKPLKNSNCTESKMQKVKSVLLRYASQKKEDTKTNEKREIMTILKVSYFKRLSLSLKTNRRKKESVESKMGIKEKLLQKFGDRIGIRH
ncbi:hypothetical protein L2E82_35503 [Cichorium intybus]|uniref:Uncharacterized protein n=1 Tax=Cichorium intybus TaxID=13427 RepID=A0ACB9BNZ8_CICIN|nr:hypothetical protein L2E82_35503 [Cichorium intybus]